MLNTSKLRFRLERNLKPLLDNIDKAEILLPDLIFGIKRNFITKQLYARLVKFPILDVAKISEFAVFTALLLDSRSSQ